MKEYVGEENLNLELRPSRKSSGLEVTKQALPIKKLTPTTRQSNTVLSVHEYFEDIFLVANYQGFIQYLHSFNQN